MAEDNSADLTDIDGVGPSTADNLRDVGLETVEDVVSADDDALEEALSGLPQSNDSIRSSAEELAQESIEELHDDAEEAVEEAIEAELEQLEAEIDEEDAGLEDEPEFHAIEFQASGQIGYHVVNSVVREAVRMRQRNRFDDEDALYAVAFQLMRDLVRLEQAPQDVDDLTFSFHATQRNLDYVHQAVSAGMSNYRGMSGLPNLWADIREVVEQLDEARSDVRE